MSRLTGTDAYGLMEAYNAVYAPQELTEEQVWEEVETWVNDLIEEGYDLSDYTWEDMYESYLEEAGMDVFKAIKDANSKPSPVFTQPIKKAPPLGQPGSGFQDRRPVLGMPSNNSLTLPPNRVGPGLVGGKVGPKIVGPKIVGPKIVGPGKVGPGAAPAPRSSTPVAPAGAPSKVAPTKPAAATQTGDKAKDMATWASTPANKGLAAAAAERARTRGTSQSDNPLMKGMPGKRPMTPSVQSPTLAKDLGKGSGNQSLLNNPNASKAATPPPAAKVTPAATSSVGQKASGLSLGSSQFKATTLKKEDFDVFDVIKGHLLDEGYADSEESALAIMANMSEEWRQSIVEDFPNVLNFPSQGGSRSGDAGTRGLKMIQTPGGQRGYINKHSGGEILPSGTVNKIMGGNLMVKNKNPKSNIQTA
jgi:hypothetical protein